MKISLFATAITLSAMFTTNATAQQIEAGQNDQFLLASNRGSGSSRGSSTTSTPSGGNTTRSTPSNAPSGSNVGNSSVTGRGKLQDSPRSGSDNRGSLPNIDSNPEPKSTISKNKKDHVRNNHRPHGPRHHRHGTPPPPPPEGGDVVVVTTSNTYVESTPAIDDAIPPIMAEIYAGGNLSSLGDNDMHLGFSAGAKGEFGLTRRGYYGSIGARFSRQNFSVCYGSDFFPNDKSEVEVTHLQIPTTLFGYRGYIDDNVLCGVGVGLIYQYGIGGTTTSKYHDDFDYTYYREKVDTYNDGLMSRSDLHGRVEIYICINRITITGEASFGIINHNHFPNNVTNWECSRNLQADNYMLTLGYRLF